MWPRVLVRMSNDLKSFFYLLISTNSLVPSIVGNARTKFTNTAGSLNIAVDNELEMNDKKERLQYYERKIPNIGMFIFYFITPSSYYSYFIAPVKCNTKLCSICFSGVHT